MTPTLLQLGASPAASILLKVTLTTAIALTAVWIARRSRASLRHALLSAAFAILLVLPVASLLTPPVRIAIPTTAPRASTAAAPAAIATFRASAVAHTSSMPSLATLLLAAWLAGAALSFIPVATGLWQLRTLRRTALPWRHRQPLAASLAIDTGIHPRVDILIHESLPGPMTCGLLRPAIILSPDAQSWDQDDLTRALVHELEHVRRADWAGLCLARTLTAVYWFHPLVWIAYRQLALEAERSCDDAVLRRSEATAYAGQLVALAQRLSTARSPLLAMANRADLSTRVRAVLDHRQPRGRAGRFAVALASAAAAIAVVTMSPLRMVASPQVPLPNFAVSTQLVTVTVTAKDASGNPIETLTSNDFTLTEDGVPQTINVFEFQKLTPPQNGLSSYYVLGYYTRSRSADGAFRKIAVTTKDASTRLDFRTGYYGPKQFAAPAPAPDRPATAVQPIPGMRPPVIIFKKDPEYSEEARKAKYQGTALLQVEIDPTGHVTSVQVIRSLGLGLDEKAMDAVRQWRFKPGTLDGQPVTTQSQVEVTFRLL